MYVGRIIGKLSRAKDKKRIAKKLKERDLDFYFNPRFWIGDLINN